jgi:hypothetical protein
MRLPAPFVSGIIASREPIILADAAALVSVAAWADAPEGVAVLPVTGAPVGGVCFGSGHRTAVAEGLREGMLAVRVDVAGIIRTAIEEEPTDEAQAVYLAGIVAEAVACHEVAHGLVSPLDRPMSREAAIESLAGLDANDWGRPSPAREAEGHNARWAAANIILQRRAARLRRHEERGFRDLFLRADLAGYGLDLDAIADALGRVPDEARLRDLLAAGGEVDRRLAAVCPGVEERAAVIAQRQRHRAAGEKLVSFEEGSDGKHRGFVAAAS